MSDLQLVTASVYALPPDGDPAFLLYFCTSKPKPGKTVSMSDAWLVYGGYFIVVPEVAAAQDLTDLANAIAVNAAFVPPAATSFAWTSWDAADKKLSAPLILPLERSPAGFVVAATTRLASGRYGVLMPKGSPVTADVRHDGSIDRFTITYAPPLVTAPPSNGAGPVIAMSGASRFCFRGEGLIGDPTEDPHTGFDISLRYFNASTSFRYPLFEPWPEGYHLLVDFVWDPLIAFPDSAYAQRSRYSLTALAFTIAAGEQPGTWVLSGAEQPNLASCFRGRFGEPVLLRPLFGTSSPPAFVPQAMPDGWYLVPSGDFALTLAPDADGQSRLLGGLIGTEFFELDSLGCVLTFVEGQPAFATAGGALDPTWTTAWTRLRSDGSTPVYFTQPPASPLFDQSGGAAVLPLFDVILSGVDPATPFPLTGYGRAAGDPAAYTSFETGVLAPARKTILAKAGGNIPLPRARSGAGTQGKTQNTTPQGFLVDVDGTTWTNLRLATGGTGSLSIATVSDALRMALQSPQLFLVVTLPIETLSPALFIAQWPFQVNVGTNGTGGGMDQFRNVLIFKFCDGSVLDRVNDAPSSWTDASTFNDPATLPQLQAWLRTYVGEGIQSGASAFDSFNTLVQDPAWNGVLALRVDVTEALPGNLQGIIAGIDLTKFYGHHVGINATPVTAPGQPPPASSLFALIDYADFDPSPTVQNRPPPTAGGAEATAYSFRVLTVLTRFANSQIVTFESDIVLTMTQLFSEPVQLQVNPGAPPVQQSSISLAGHLEMHDGAAVYTFTSDTAARFLFPSSNVFYYVDITNSQFQTLGVTAANGVSTITSRFSLWGFLSFQPTPGIDIFSFGNDPSAQPAGTPSALAYANLGINMSFQLVDPLQPTVVFTFDPSAIGFDPDQSTARPSTAENLTLYSALPLQLGTILSGSGVLPQQNGFFNVFAPAIGGVAGLVPSQWYALSLTLNLGTMGALAGLGSFNAQLIAAWSPGGIVQQVALLMQLPGTAPGKSELSLQSVLRLGIGQITAAIAGESLELTFANVGLVFLGVTLPRGAAINVSLFGNSDAVTTSSLGWYATYAAKGP